MMFSSRNFQLWLCCQFFHVFYVRPQVTGQPMTGSYLVRHSPLGQVAQDNVCCCSVTQSCLTFCDSIDCSMPGLSVPYHLLKFVQVHVHCISDVIQPSHPLTPSSPSALNLSKHQGFFQLYMIWEMLGVPVALGA